MGSGVPGAVTGVLDTTRVLSCRSAAAAAEGGAVSRWDSARRPPGSSPPAHAAGAGVSDDHAVQRLRVLVLDSFGTAGRWCSSASRPGPRCRAAAASRTRHGPSRSRPSQPLPGWAGRSRRGGREAASGVRGTSVPARSRERRGRGSPSSVMPGRRVIPASSTSSQSVVMSRPERRLDPCPVFVTDEQIAVAIDMWPCTTGLAPPKAPAQPRSSSPARSTAHPVKSQLR